jgi:predicted nucleotidyltransferase
LITPDREALRAAALEHGLDLVVLFGSTAKGRRHADSDLDVAVRFATSGTSLSTLREEARVEGSLLEALQPRCEVDLVVLNGASPLLKWNVARDGVPLFCRSDATWTSFRIAAHREFEDTAKFRRRRWHELVRRLDHDTSQR